VEFISDLQKLTWFCRHEVYHREIYKRLPALRAHFLTRRSLRRFLSQMMRQTPPVQKPSSSRILPARSSHCTITRFHAWGLASGSRIQCIGGLSQQRHQQRERDSNSAGHHSDPESESNVASGRAPALAILTEPRAGHLQQLRDLRKEPAFLQGAQTALKRCLVLRETGAYVCAGGHAIKLLSKVVALSCDPLKGARPAKAEPPGHLPRAMGPYSRRHSRRAAGPTVSIPQ